jgi:hypothetical protein
MGIYVSEGLEHPFEWYITEMVIYHHYKLTHRGQPDQQLAGQGGQARTGPVPGSLAIQAS